MKQFLRKAVSPVVLGSLLILIVASNHYAQDPFKDVFSYLLLVGLLMGFIMRLNKCVLIPYRKGQNVDTSALMPFLVIALTTGSIVAFTHFKRSKDVLLQAHTDGGLSRTILELKTDGSVVAEENSFLGSSFHYGQYRLEGDLVYLSNTQKVAHLTNATLQIINSKDGTGQIMIPVNLSQQVDTNSHLFYVTMDERGMNHH
jgi:hypothetical protein